MMRADDKFQVADGTDVLQLGPRHVQPCTDEVVASVFHRTTGGQRSAVLRRADVTGLRDWCDRWLAEGWDGVARRCGAVAQPDRLHRWECTRDPDDGHHHAHRGRATGWCSGEQPAVRCWTGEGTAAVLLPPGDPEWEVS